MKQTRWLIVSIALGVATALTIPAASLAHEVEVRSADFNGNTFSGGANVAHEQIQAFFVETFDGAFKFEGQRGRGTEGKLANAFAVLAGWDVHSNGTCSHWQETWEAQSELWTENQPGRTLTFPDAYSGSMDVAYEMHGFRLSWDDLQYLPDKDICAWEERDSDRREHLGEATLEVAASWESVVTSPGKGKKNRGQQVSTTVSFGSVTFAGQPVEIVFSDEPPSPFAMSGLARYEIAIYNMVDTHS